jgi:hypothetical protein
MGKFRKRLDPRLERVNGNGIHFRSRDHYYAQMFTAATATPPISLSELSIPCSHEAHTLLPKWRPRWDRRI